MDYGTERFRLLSEQIPARVGGECVCEVVGKSCVAVGIARDFGKHQVVPVDGSHRGGGIVGRSGGGD